MPAPDGDPTYIKNKERYLSCYHHGRDKAEPIIKRYKFIKGFKEGSLDFYSSKKGNQSTKIV